MTGKLRMIRRFLMSFFYYLGNGIFMGQPSYNVRHWFLKIFLGVKIGKKSSIHYGCFLTGDEYGSKIEIGSNTVINRFTYLDGRVSLKIGNNVNVSHYTLIQTLSHDPQSPDFVCITGPVVICDHAWIGARAVILPGVTIGEGSVIGAGSVVASSIPPYSIAVGAPAKVVKSRNRDLRYKSAYFPFFNTDICS